jgi:hypothetical protein
MTKSDKYLVFKISGPPQSSTPAPAAPATVWNSQTPLTAAIKANAAASASNDTNDVDPWLQLPKVDSLFNYDGGNVSTSTLLSSSNNFPGLSSHLSKPDLSSPPPTIQRSASASNTNGFSGAASNSSGSSRFGGLGSTSTAAAPFDGSSSNQTCVESLNRRLTGLSMCNADLLTQLANKERQLQHFSKMIAPQEELVTSHENLKQELDEAKREISRLRLLLESKDGDRNKEKAPTPPPVSDNYLIISLQHQLESERLNSRNLKHQLELERAYSTKVTEKHNYLLNRFHSSGGGQIPGTPVGLGDSGGGGRQTDSFGLRGLLANTTSALRDDSASRFTIGGSAVAPPSSSACFSPGSSSVINKPPISSSFSLHSSSPPIQLSGANFSSSFGGSGAGNDLSSLQRSEDFQRRLTGPSSRVVLPSATQALVNSMTSQTNK